MTRRDLQASSTSSTVRHFKFWPIVLEMSLAFLLTSLDKALADGAAILPLPLLSQPLQTAVALPSLTASSELTLSQIAQLPPTNYPYGAFGDTDHDGMNEFIQSWIEHIGNNIYLHYIILEEQGNNSYPIEYTGEALIPYATGDLDKDGKSEIIGQLGGQILVYESIEPTSYPSQLVWSTSISNVIGLSTVGDTDQDGRMEIIHSQNFLSGSSRLRIFENGGDNSYDEVLSTTVGSGAMGEKVIADLDGDGLTEIALSGEVGRVYVYESPGNNVWQLTWTESTELLDAYAAEGGVDTDGNGEPELFIMGNTESGWTTIVYESSGDNRFSRVATLVQYDGSSGEPHNALGNLDGSGPNEYLMQSKLVAAYRARDPGQWESVAKVADPNGGGHFGLHVFDVNRNGKDEVFWQGVSTTLVFEDIPKTTDVHQPPAQDVSAMRISPNPCRQGATIRLPPTRFPAIELAIYDVRGRLVHLQPIEGLTDQIFWQATALHSGTYFVRLRDRSGLLLAEARATIVK